MKNLLLIVIVSFAVSGCMTLKPDSIKLEADFNPQDKWKSDEVTLGGVWKLK